MNLPRQIEVKAGEQGAPSAVQVRRSWKRAISIQNAWRLDDEWWRREISRLYFDVELEGGMLLTIFHDLVSGLWYRQGK